MTHHKYSVYLVIATLAFFPYSKIPGQTAPEHPARLPAPIVIDATAPPPSNDYPLTRDSLRQPDVPVGKVFQFEMNHSTVFPATTRTITVYVPAEYKGEKPACLYVGLDGLGFHAPTVFDNLIAQHAMPVTIAIGVSPGTVASAKPPANPRFDRSFEFDSRSDRLARFILNDVIPEVEKHATPDGRRILFSNNPNDRAIGGASTGGIGAFTVAWERPNAFRRVFSAIGTYVGMRGGESYYVLVRKTEPKPLRIFMQDGIHDEWPGGPEMGDWWMSNQTMQRALEFAGYDVRHVWGVGTHNDHQAAMVFPEAMRWLWRNWPAPVTAGVSSNPVLRAVLAPHEDWQLVAEGCPSSLYLTANPQGEVFFETVNRRRIVNRAPNGPCTSRLDVTASAFGPNGRFYRSNKDLVLPKGTRVRDFIVRSNGDIYATADTGKGMGELWFERPNGEKKQLDTGLKAPSGVAVSLDGLWLFVAQNHSKFGMSYRILADGTVDAREPFYQFYVPAWADDSGAEQVAVDKDGRAYVATRMGVQIFDRNGRVTAILPLPDNGSATGLCFGDAGFNVLYVTSNGKIYKRKLRVAGAPPWSPAVVLPPWNPG